LVFLTTWLDVKWLKADFCLILLVDLEIEEEEMDLSYLVVPFTLDARDWRWLDMGSFLCMKEVAGRVRLLMALALI
jgi:hypothetical protein